MELDADDEGLLLGRSAFETLRTYQGVLFGIEAHLERLAASCHALEISAPDEDRLVEELIGAAELIDGEAVVRVTVTALGTRVVRSAPLPDVPSPFRCVTRHWVPPAWLDGTVKHASRAFSRMAVLESGMEEVIWTDSDGFMLEGTRSNIFAVVSGELHTPAVDGRLLGGVTRAAILDTADAAGIPVRLEAIHKDQSFDELYVSSTLKELTPIDSLNGEKTPGWGPVGRRLFEAFRQSVLEN